MTTSYVIQIGRETVLTTLIVVAPMMIVGFVVGISVALFQAIMQLHEMTLTFIPKMIAIAASLIFFGSFMLEKLIDYTQNIFKSFAMLVGG